jgi:hypothetical protein
LFLFLSLFWVLSFYEILQGVIKRIQLFSMCKAPREIYFVIVNLNIDRSRDIRGGGFSLKAHLGLVR